MSAPAARFSIQLYATAPGGPVNWRLLSANHRECGRGIGAFADADACLASVAELQRALDRATRRLTRVDAHRCGWVLDLDGAPVAASGRSFDRLVRCEQGLQVFLAEFAAAPLRASMPVVGARRSRSVA